MAELVPNAVIHRTRFAGRTSTKVFGFASAVKAAVRLMWMALVRYESGVPNDVHRSAQMEKLR